MSRSAKAIAVAGFHASWIIGTIILPATPMYRLVPVMLVLAVVGNWIWKECPLLLWEFYYRPFEDMESMTRRLFRIVGIHFEEDQEVGRWVYFLSGLALAQSLIRLIFE